MASDSPLADRLVEIMLNLASLLGGAGVATVTVPHRLGIGLGLLGVSGVLYLVCIGVTVIAARQKAGIPVPPTVPNVQNNYYYIGGTPTQGPPPIIEPDPDAPTEEDASSEDGL
jgi:hypothetical protein